MSSIQSISRRSLGSLMVASLLIAGCGSDDDDADAPATADESDAGDSTAQPTDAPPPESAADGTSAPADDDVSGTLTFWSNLEGGQLEWFNQFVSDFEAAHPDANIEATQLSTEEYWAKLVASFAAGDEPDIFSNPSGELFERHARAGQLGDLDGLIAEDAFNPAALDNFRSAEGGELYGVPLQQFAIMMWANEALLAEHGLTPPTTWDELLNACKVLSDAGIAAISLGNGGQDTWTAQFLIEVLAYQYGGKDVFTDATFGRNGASWADEPFVQAGTALRELVDAECFPEGFNGLNYSQMQSMFLQQEAAMMFMGSWFAAQLDTVEGMDDVAVVPFPDAPDAVNSTEALDILLGGVTGWAATKSAVEDNPELVAAFLNAFGAAADEYANANSVLSAAANPVPQGGEIQASMTDMLTGSTQLVRVMDNVTPSAIHAPYFQSVFELTSGELTPEEWAQAMADSVELERPEFEDLSG
jgi:ABC-type glycerol-3-phosphate transport system substrate-binding protein